MAAENKVCTYWLFFFHFCGRWLRFCFFAQATHGWMRKYWC